MRNWYPKVKEKAKGLFLMIISVTSIWNVLWKTTHEGIPVIQCANNKWMHQSVIVSLIAFNMRMHILSDVKMCGSSL